MSLETNSNKTKVCPTCGTRLSENATRCLVCGTEFNAPPEPRVVRKAQKSVQASKMPAVTLSLPVAVGILAAVILAAVVIAFVVIGRGRGGNSLAPTESPTSAATATETQIATQTLTPTNAPTSTTISPFDYTVGVGEYCSTIAFNFGVSVQSIIIANNLPSNCPLSQGQIIKVPYPTPTVPPPPTNTPLPVDATRQNCETVPITVQQYDTLSSISANYAVSMAAIKEWNGLTVDTVFIGQKLFVPLCKRAQPPGPTLTATIPPPYPAPNLLLPADGAAFTLANDVVTLQWASVGVLRDGEAYQITVEDVTADQTRRLTDYATDTKYIVPTSYRSKDNVAHVLRWWITPVRQSGTDDQGQPIWVVSGAVSDKRVFTWIGVAVEGTPAP